MCRSIVTLRRPEPTTTGDVEAAALQFVRKVSGFRKPSTKNAAVFDAAVAEISTIVERLLADIGTAVAVGAATPHKPSPRPAAAGPTS
jgi:hypothetical protein